MNARRQPSSTGDTAGDADEVAAAALRVARALHWSDGSVSLRELCDLYGRRGFEVLAVTDHAPRDARRVQSVNHADYLRAVGREADRARDLYDLLVLPGLELTCDDADPLRAAHVVALGLRDSVDVRAELERVLAAAREQAALVVAHPYAPEQLDGCARAARRRDALHGRVRRAAGVGNARRPVRAVQPAHALRLGRCGQAAGRGHGRLPPARAPRDVEDAPACGKEESAILDYLRSPRPAYLLRLDEAAERVAAWLMRR